MSKGQRLFFVKKMARHPLSMHHMTSYSDVVGKVLKIFKKPKHKNLS